MEVPFPNARDQNANQNAKEAIWHSGILASWSKERET
jgi:hypothetical protein